MRTGEMTCEELLGSLNETERINAPERLFVAGDTSLLRSSALVSVIGSRSADLTALARTRSLVAALVNRGITVVSGLAEGIDTKAHQTALAEHGHTVAVLGTPLDQVYPSTNRMLQERLMENELVVSQFASGTPVKRENFPMRNRTMALLSDATIIVAASDRSGTLYQGWEALRLGRLLFLLESVAMDPNLSWPSKMIHYGAQVLSRENLEFALDEMPQARRGDPFAL